MARWRIRLSRFDFYVIRRARFKLQAADPLSRLIITVEDQASMKDKLQVAVHETTAEYMPSIQLVSHMTVPSNETDVQTEAQVFEDNDAEKRRVAPTLQEFFHYQATEAFCKKAVENVGQANAESTIDKNGLVVRMARIRGAVQVVVHQTLWSCLLYR